MNDEPPFEFLASLIVLAAAAILVYKLTPQ
jgi:hypothetical protein